ncbi:hypothetical protein Pmani_029052 [Petrolisthes manimaculis]|uniref:Uncharacterized protein n=1 Tax=Petrolisthes manimaculis TaxID=1843537 RepID=A0AAE1P0R4_9EUCA|nr:hypothetical protein Pmani_029052 [Petrolisthes manimaculis]
MAEDFKLPTFTYNINAMLIALYTDVLCLLQALHTTPTDGTSYETAKASLLQALGKPKQSYLSELDNLQVRGRRPFLLLSHIWPLATSSR